MGFNFLPGLRPCLGKVDKPVDCPPLVLKRATARHAESLIRGWILSLKRNPRTTHLDDHYWGAYYWSEREYQWALVSHMKKYAWREGFGSARSVHAEGSWERPKHIRRADWKVRKRSDIVIVNHQALLRWWKSGPSSVRDFPMEVAVEMKITWGAGKDVRKLIRADIHKLSSILKSGATKAAYLVWLDSIRTNGPRKGGPFFSPREIQELRQGSGVKIFHWPDGDEPILGTGGTAQNRDWIKHARIGLYPPR